MIDVILHHNPIMAATALLSGFLGTVLSFILIFNIRGAEGPRRLHWLLISSIIFGGAQWTMNLLLYVGHFGGITHDFDMSVLVQAAVFAMTTRFLGFYLNSSFPDNRIQQVSRVILAGSIAIMPYYTSTAFLGPHTVSWMLYVVCGIGTLCTYILICALSLKLRNTPSLRQLSWIAIRFTAISALIYVSTVYTLHLDSQLDEAHQVLDVAADQLVAPVVFVMVLLVIVGSSTFHVDRAATAQAVERYRHLAMHDSLTGLQNRLSMQLDIDRLVAPPEPEAQPFAVAVIDLDRFKDVNDVHGHAAGDALLKGIAQDFQDSLQEGEAIYRTGGDEFVATKIGVTDPEDAAEFGWRFCRIVDEFDAWMTGNVRVGATVGTSLFPNDGNSTGDLLSRADLAMYRAKALGRGRVSNYNLTMDESQRQKKALSMDLRSAIKNDELEIYWQPQIDAKSGLVVGFEALLRWEHAQRGTVSPAEFIPLAEQTGQIVDIGEWVLLHACLEATKWARPYRIAVNVAAGQLNQSDLPGLVAATLNDTGLPPSRLEIEITETGIIQDENKTLETVLAIKSMGVSIAMDDFGTGYSSLSTLQTFPFDKIKIDRAFIAAMGEAPSADVIVEATIQIAHAMGLKVLAEGVETLDQVKQLQSVSCHEFQGYYFSKPISIDVARRKYGLMDTTLDQFDADTNTETQPPHRRKDAI